jgi:hypothetical protein
MILTFKEVTLSHSLVVEKETVKGSMKVGQDSAGDPEVKHYLSYLQLWTCFWNIFNLVCDI